MVAGGQLKTTGLQENVCKLVEITAGAWSFSQDNNETQRQSGPGGDGQNLWVKVKTWQEKKMLHVQETKQNKGKHDYLTQKRKKRKKVTGG